MLEIVSFRSEEDVAVMSLNEEVEFQVLINAIQERLRLFKENKVKTPEKIKIDIGHRKIKPSELLEIFDIVMKEKITIIDGIDSKIDEFEDTQVYEGVIRGGQIKYFDSSVMIMGDINPGATVYCGDNLYVVGTIRGKVIAKKKESQIVASTYKNCLIQIFDSEPKYIEKLNGNILTYENGFIKVHDNNLKGAIIDGKNNRNYIR
jgi:septum site-determining protein MinC